MAWGQESYKLETGGAAPAQIPAAVRAVLEAHADILADAHGAPVCEIWWRRGVPEQKSTAASGDVLYGGLSMGEFLGVLRFPKAGTDYRGQAVKPGFYTLRYALIPQDGNHMGVSSFRDFVLLVPVADDVAPKQNLAFDALMKASRLATGTGHPGVMMLDPVLQDPSAKYPAAEQDDQGNWALNVKLDVTSGGQPQQLPLALVLVGQYQG